MMKKEVQQRAARILGILNFATLAFFTERKSF
jgi:hypothetical protein